MGLTFAAVWSAWISSTGTVSAALARRRLAAANARTVKTPGNRIPWFRAAVFILGRFSAFMDGSLCRGPTKVQRTFAPPRARSPALRLVAEGAEDALQAAPATGFFRAEHGRPRMRQIELHQKADAVRAASAGANRVNAVGVA